MFSFLSNMTEEHLSHQTPTFAIKMRSSDDIRVFVAQAGLMIGILLVIVYRRKMMSTAFTWFKSSVSDLTWCVIFIGVFIVGDITAFHMLGGVEELRNAMANTRMPALDDGVFLLVDIVKGYAFQRVILVIGNKAFGTTRASISTSHAWWYAIIHIFWSMSEDLFNASSYTNPNIWTIIGRVAIPGMSLVLHFGTLHVKGDERDTTPVIMSYRKNVGILVLLVPFCIVLVYHTYLNVPTLPFELGEVIYSGLSPLISLMGVHYLVDRYPGQYPHTKWENGIMAFSCGIIAISTEYFFGLIVVRSRNNLMLFIASNSLCASIYILSVSATKPILGQTTTKNSMVTPTWCVISATCLLFLGGSAIVFSTFRGIINPFTCGTLSMSDVPVISIVFIDNLCRTMIMSKICKMSTFVFEIPSVFGKRKTLYCSLNVLVAIASTTLYVQIEKIMRHRPLLSLILMGISFVASFLGNIMSYNNHTSSQRFITT